VARAHYRSASRPQSDDIVHPYPLASKPQTLREVLPALCEKLPIGGREN
jgi:hypothetical protein